MNFSELYETISPRIKRIAENYSYRDAHFDKEDLYQEMSLHLWNNFKEGKPPDLNESYIVKGCEFHLLNFIRKNRLKARVSSLDDLVNEEGDALKDVLPDESISTASVIERNININDIVNNGFTPREKQVFALLLQGLTAREAGKELGISHVMVLKLKNRLIKKWHKKDKRLPG